MVGSVMLQWSPPNNTGGLDVNISHYVVNVARQNEQLFYNVTTTSINITGLVCNVSYAASVRAANCIGEGNSSNSVVINIPVIGRKIF